MKNAQWDLHRTDGSTSVYALSYEECSALHNEYESLEYPNDGFDDPAADADSALLFRAADVPSEWRIRIERGKDMWNDEGERLGPWTQLFIGYAKNAQEWAKHVTGC